MLSPLGITSDRQSRPCFKEFEIINGMTVWGSIKKGGIHIEKKQKYAYWLEPSLVEEMSNMLDEANATSKGEFVRQAIRFYISYLHQKKSIDFISPLLANTIKSEIESVEYNISEMLFKVAVELGILNNLNAVDCNCNMETLSALRNSCANVVAQSNGIINFEKAYEWQHSEY